MKYAKRILSLALALVMLLGLMPAAAWAGEAEKSGVPQAAKEGGPESPLAETVTLTFNAHGHGTAPDPITVQSGTKWGTVLNAHPELAMSEADGLYFGGWSKYVDDFRNNVLGGSYQFTEDQTLYAAWLEPIRSLELWVDQPAVGSTADQPKACVEKYTFCTVTPSGWYLTATGQNAGNRFTGAFEAGKTYYGRVLIVPGDQAIFPEAGNVVAIRGATAVSEEVYDGGLIVVFSVTLPSASSSSPNAVDLWLDTPVPGSSIDMAPAVCCLTPGVTVTPDAWWNNLEDVEDYSLCNTRGFGPGNTYYTAVDVRTESMYPFGANPQIRCGGSGEVVRVTTMQGSYVQRVVLKMSVPECHNVYVNTQGRGWFFFDDNPHAKPVLDGAYIHAGQHTLTAKADPGWIFDGWYDENENLLSDDRTYTFSLNGDIDGWTAVFVEGQTVDRVEIEVPIPSAGDTFDYYTDSTGAVVTNGAHVQMVQAVWYNEWGLSGTPLIFEAGKNYFVGIDFQAESGWAITEDTVFTINGEDVVWKSKISASTWSVSSRNYCMTFKPISSVDFRVAVPNAGDSFNYETQTAGAVVTNGAPVTIVKNCWYTEGGVSGTPLPFEAGQNYFVEIEIQAEAGYEITEDTVFTVNGEPVAWKSKINVSTWSVASRNYTMQTAQKIEKLALQLHHVPAAGEIFDPAYDGVFLSTMEQIEWIDTMWRKAQGTTEYPLTFENGGMYRAYCEVTGQPGWQLTKDTAVTIDGVPVGDWVELGAGRFGFTTGTYFVHEKQVIPAVKVYANALIVEVGPTDPYIPSYMPYEVEDWIWADANGNQLPKDFQVAEGMKYSLTILVKPKDGYMFSTDELIVSPFLDTSVVVSVESQRLTIRGTCTAIKRNPFVDVKQTDYFYEPVMWAYLRNPQVTAGTDATHFSPKKDCTRGQVVTFLWRANGCPEPTSTDCPFTDVKKGAYYYKAMLWAVETGVTTGTSATTFSPNKACTRAQVVTFLWRSKGSPEPASSECPFTDVKPTSSYYKAILWAVEQGVTTGTTVTTFSPSKACNRGQVVTFLYRVYGPKG